MGTVIADRIRKPSTEGAACHGGPQVDPSGLSLVAIVGCPNVGKSVLFNALTGAYVTVSNYPGTTVELTRGKGRLDGMEVGVVDTPGMYRLLPITEEERVARDILLTGRPLAVVHVVEARNLERMLPLTLQLIETGLPVVLDVNLMDEAERLGMRVDAAALELALGIPVVTTALATGRGLGELRQRLAARLRGPRPTHGPRGDGCCAQATAATGHPADPYPAVVEAAVAEIESRLRGSYHVSKRSVALLLLQGDADVAAFVREQESPRADEIAPIVAAAQSRLSEPISYLVAQQQRRAARRIVAEAVSGLSETAAGWAARLSRVTMNPLTGLPILALTLVAVYQFVGVLGAQTLVGWLEGSVFGEHINPWVDATLSAFVPWEAVRELVGAEYGILTLGVRYAVALILPIVGTFFLALAVIEDSGYLPRLAMLIDRVFKRIGLNGRAVIPMVLGFGCDTMATIVTRTLETRRERILSTLLLALAIPCSAQFGVMIGLLGGRPVLLLLWSLVVALVFLLVGFLAARVLPGERPSFYMELPPLRWPNLPNVAVKTYTRMEWYFREVFPVFIFASVLIWVGRLTGLFDLLVGALEPLMRWMGLPEELAVAFLFGFFRRDYGAAGLYDLQGALTGAQLLVATVTLTLFVPCVAQFAITLKERGWRTALALEAFIFPFAFLVGGLLMRLIAALGWTL